MPSLDEILLYLEPLREISEMTDFTKKVLPNMRNVHEHLANVGRTAAIVATINALLRQKGSTDQLRDEPIKCLRKLTKKNELWDILDGSFKVRDWSNEVFKKMKKIFESPTPRGFKTDKEYYKHLLDELKDCLKGTSFHCWEDVWRAFASVGHFAYRFKDLDDYKDKGFTNDQLLEAVRYLYEFMAMSKELMWIEKRLREKVM